MKKVENGELVYVDSDNIKGNACSQGFVHVWLWAVTMHLMR